MNWSLEIAVVAVVVGLAGASVIRRVYRFFSDSESSVCGSRCTSCATGNNRSLVELDVRVKH